MKQVPAMGTSLSDQHMLMRILAIQVQRNFYFHGETDPSSLRWENVLWDLEDDPRFELFRLEHTHYSDVEKGNNQILASRPRRVK